MAVQSCGVWFASYWRFRSPPSLRCCRKYTHPTPGGQAEESAVMGNQPEEPPQMEHESTPAMEHESTPAMEHESDPAMEHESDPAMEHESDPAMEHESDPAMEHE